jgi:hypothetical protein
MAEMIQVQRVRECQACGEVCGIMDTRCPGCQQYGTLRERLRCSRCGRLLDGKTCWACTAPAGIREETPDLPAPLTDLVERSVPDLIDHQAIRPWVAGAVGGAVLGSAAAAVGAFFLNADPLIGGLIGLTPGAVLGALMNGSNMPHSR